MLEKATEGKGQGAGKSKDTKLYRHVGALVLIPKAVVLKHSV